MKFSLKSPVKPFILNQKFGDNQACVQDGQGKVTLRKIIGKVNNSCPVGFKELYPQLGMKGHTGIDLRAYHGQTLCHGASRGIIEEISTEEERGLGIGVVTLDKFTFPDGEFNVKVRYWHLKSINVKKGEIVNCGDVIGTCDNTGVSAGDHLHFEVKRVAKNSKGAWYNVDQDNGYFGSINPLPYFDGTYAVDVKLKLLISVRSLLEQVLTLIK